MKVMIFANNDIGLYKFRKELIQELVKANEVFMCLPNGDFIKDLQSLGANFIVIGFILPIVTYSFYKLFLNLNKKLAIFGSTIIGIIAATFGQVGILLISGAMNFDLLLSTLVPFYLFISIIEGFCNVVIITSIEKIKPELIEINEI